MHSYLMTERDTGLSVLLGVGYGVNIRKRAMQAYWIVMNVDQSNVFSLTYSDMINKHC